MSMAIRLPRKRTPDFSYRALREAKSSLERVKARHDEVFKVSEAVRTFTENHLLTVHVEEKPDQSDENKD